MSLDNLQGGYWTLEKRQPDLHRMPAEWRRTVASFAGSFPQVFQRPSVQVSSRMQHMQVQPCKPVRCAHWQGLPHLQQAGSQQSQWNSPVPLLDLVWLSPDFSKRTWPTLGEIVVDRGLMLGATRSSVLVSEHEVPQLLFLSMEKLVAINASRLCRGSSTSICSSARAPSLGWGLVQSLLARLNSSRVSPFARQQARASDTSIGTGSGGAPGSCSVQAACPAGRQGHGLDTGHKAWELPVSTTLDAAAWRLQGAAAA